MGLEPMTLLWGVACSEPARRPCPGSFFGVGLWGLTVMNLLCILASSPLSKIRLAHSFYLRGSCLRETSKCLVWCFGELCDGEGSWQVQLTWRKGRTRKFAGGIPNVSSRGQKKPAHISGSEGPKP